MENFSFRARKADHSLHISKKQNFFADIKSAASIKTTGFQFDSERPGMRFLKVKVLRQRRMEGRT